MENCVLVEVRSWNVYSGDENDWVYGGDIIDVIEIEIWLNLVSGEMFEKYT
jgi:hypothetical protein